MRPLVGVDWGTTSLRAARLGAQGVALEERSLPRGILSVPAGGFPAVLQETCGAWLDDPSTLVLVSGMAGSRQGWIEAPYCHCPAGLADIASQLAWAEPGRVAIVPGLDCEHHGVPDVMRGEETQVVGALALLGIASARLVLPGTHSKWVDAVNGRIERFSTFMTGEVYALLRRHSILARTMPDEDGDLDEAAFTRGVEAALRSGSLLNAAFSARTLSLFDRLPATSMPSYLSGLVIGEEMRSQHAGQRAPEGDPVIVIGAEALTLRYEIALRSIGGATRRVGSEATWRGLWAIAQILDAQ